MGCGNDFDSGVIVEGVVIVCVVVDKVKIMNLDMLIINVVVGMLDWKLKIIDVMIFLCNLKGFWV